jgi:transposase InsO family protein
MEASPYTDTLATRVAGFGMPTTVTTDRGTQFTFALWTSKCKRLGIQQGLNTSYQPQSNSMVKCLHRKIKVALCAMCMWSRSSVAFPSPLGSVRNTCSAKGGLHGVFSRVGHPFILPRQLLHVPDTPHVDVAPLPMKPASYAAAAC